METSYELKKNYGSASGTKAAKSFSLDKFYEDLKFSYFGIIAMTILIGSILGGIATMFVMQNHSPIWQLTLVMFASMANNVSAIGQAPLKWVLGTFVGCCLICTLAICINF